MKPTVWNKLKLFFHCLIHPHRTVVVNDRDEEYIMCWDCGYGKPEER